MTCSSYINVLKWRRSKGERSAVTGFQLRMVLGAPLKHYRCHWIKWCAIASGTSWFMIPFNSINWLHLYTSSPNTFTLVILVADSIHSRSFFQELQSTTVYFNLLRFSLICSSCFSLAAASRDGLLQQLLKTWLLLCSFERHGSYFAASKYMALTCCSF